LVIKLSATSFFTVEGENRSSGFVRSVGPFLPHYMTSRLKIQHSQTSSNLSKTYKYPGSI